MAKKAVFAVLGALLALGAANKSAVAATCSCNDVWQIECPGWNPFLWRPCDAPGKVCTYNEEQLLVFMQDCCPAFGSGAHAGFENCMIGKGGFLCSTVDICC